METTVLSLIKDLKFRDYARSKLTEECIKKKLPCSISLYPFEDLLNGKKIPESLLKLLYEKLMKLRAQYKL